MLTKIEIAVLIEKAYYEKFTSTKRVLTSIVLKATGKYNDYDLNEMDENDMDIILLELGEKYPVDID